MRAEKRTGPVQRQEVEWEMCHSRTPSQVQKQLANLSTVWPYQTVWLPIPIMFRTQQVLNEMEAAEPQDLPFPCPVYSATAAVLKNSSSSCARE